MDNRMEEAAPQEAPVSLFYALKLSFGMEADKEDID